MNYKFLTDRQTLCNLQKIQGSTGMNLFLRKDNPRRPIPRDIVLVSSGNRHVMFKILIAHPGDSFMQARLNMDNTDSSCFNQTEIGRHTIVPAKLLSGLPHEIKVWALQIEPHAEHIGHGCVVS